MGGPGPPRRPAVGSGSAGRNQPNSGSCAAGPRPRRGSIGGSGPRRPPGPRGAGEPGAFPAAAVGLLPPRPASAAGRLCTAPAPGGSAGAGEGRARPGRGRPRGRATAALALQPACPGSAGRVPAPRSRRWLLHQRQNSQAASAAASRRLSSTSRQRLSLWQRRPAPSLPKADPFQQLPRDVLALPGTAWLVQRAEKGTRRLLLKTGCSPEWGPQGGDWMPLLSPPLWVCHQPLG